MLAWRVEDRGKAMEYLARVKGDRRDQLEKDCRTQWERGNRGKWGDWRGL